MNSVILILLFGLVNYDAQRKAMVEDQIIARGIKDGRVIKSILNVERHLFVPEEYTPYAYNDYPLPIGHDQTISQPYIVALMTELIEPDSLDKVLEIGTGSGYQAAVLSALCDSVFSIEIIPDLAKSAAKRLKDLGYNNISVKCGDGFLGWPEHGPFDKIIITCSPPKIPDPLIKQLKAGGIIVLPLGVKEQWLLKVTKKGKNIISDTIIPVRFVPMKGRIWDK